MEAVTGGPSDDRAGVKTNDAGKIQPAFPVPFIENFSHPFLIGPSGGEVLIEKIGRDRTVVLTVPGPFGPALLTGR